MMNSLRVALRTSSQVRSFSALSARRNVTASTLPIGEAVRDAASRASSSIAQQASVEGFKAGVLYTLLAGSVATAGIVMLTPSGERDVKAQDLL